MPAETYPLRVAQSENEKMKAKGGPASVHSGARQGDEAAVRKTTEGTAHKGRRKGADADDYAAALRGLLDSMLDRIGEDPSWLIHLRYYIEEDPLIMLT